MRKEFVSNLLILLLLNLAIKPVYVLGVERQVQNLMGPEQYGVYYTLFSLSFLTLILADAGIQNFNNTYIAKYRVLIFRFLPGLLLLKLVLALLYLAITLVLAILGKYPTHYLSLLFHIGLNQLLLSFLLYLRSNISGLGKYRLDSFFSVLDKLVLLLLCLYPVFWVKRIDISQFVWLQTISLAVSLLSVMAFLFPYFRRMTWKWKPAMIRFLAKKSYLYALILLLMTLYTRLDVLLLQWLSPGGMYEVGKYAAAYRLLDTGNMFAFLVASLLLPMFSRALAQREDVRNLAEWSFGWIFFLALSVVIPLVWFRREVTDLLYDHTDPSWAQVLSITMISFLAFCTNYIYSTLLTAGEHLKTMIRVFLVAILLNIVLNFILIPRYQALGAAWAGLITQSLVALLQTLSVYRIHHWTIPYKRVSRSLFVVLLVLLASGQLVTLEALSWQIRFLFIGGSVLLGGLLAGILSFKGLEWLRART